MQSRASSPSQEVFSGDTVSHLEVKLQFEKDKQARLEDKYQALLQVHEKLKIDNDRLITLNEAAETRSEDLRFQLASASHKLIEYRLRFYLIPQASNVEIMNDYEVICEEVMDWIDGETIRGLKTQADPEGLFSAGGNPRFEYLLQRFPNFGEYLVRHCIHQFLQETMFRDKMNLLGLTEENVMLLQAAEQGMRKIKPARGMRLKLSKPSFLHSSNINKHF